MNEETLKEFDDTMIKDWLDADSCSDLLPSKFNYADMIWIGKLLNPRIESLLLSKITQAKIEGLKGAKQMYLDSYDKSPFEDFLPAINLKIKQLEDK